MAEFAETPSVSNNDDNVTTSAGEVSTAPAHICATPGCGKPAAMACPTCLKLGIPPSRFCSQSCFKDNWDQHKLLHKALQKARTEKDPATLPYEFKGFQFTGTLRPYQKTPRRTVPAHIARPDYAEHSQGFPASEDLDKRTNTTIRVYTPTEIEGIRAACRIGREVLDLAGAAVKVGVTGDELDRIVHEATVERGAYPSPLNYHCFPKSVCTSVNEVICHGIPDLRPLQDGDIVNIDISVYKDGYHADLNETFLVGNVNEDSVRLVKCAYEALGAAIALVKPGTLYRYDAPDTAICGLDSRLCGGYRTKP
jgi:methionyl aminopeptidase